MDGLYWKTPLKWMIWGKTYYFRKHPFHQGMFSFCAWTSPSGALKGPKVNKVRRKSLGFFAPTTWQICWLNTSIITSVKKNSIFHHGKYGGCVFETPKIISKTIYELCQDLSFSEYISKMIFLRLFEPIFVFNGFHIFFQYFALGDQTWKSHPHLPRQHAKSQSHQQPRGTPGMASRHAFRKRHPWSFTGQKKAFCPWNFRSQSWKKIGPVLFVHSFRIFPWSNNINILRNSF